MAWLSLSDTCDAKSVYLDTSVVFALMHAQGRRHSKPWADSKQASQGERVEAFLSKSQAEARWTILQAEELSSKLVRSAQLKVLGDLKFGEKDWKNLVKTADATQRLRIKDAYAVVSQMLVFALDSLNRAKVSFAGFVVPSDAEVLKRMRQKLWELQSTYHALDAMDALHIIVGGVMGCDAFVTLDKSWSEVHQISGFIG